MKFDPDCVRDILIAAEERTDGGDMEWMIAGPDESTLDGLAAYSRNIAVYHIRQCAENNLIKLGEEWIDGSFTVTDLTPKGHQTLAQLRLPKAVQLWTKAKDSGLIASAGALVQWALEIGGMVLK